LLKASSLSIVTVATRWRRSQLGPGPLLFDPGRAQREPLTSGRQPPAE
jgi:hypothetical protein